MIRIYNHYISRTVFLLVSTEIIVLMTVFYNGMLLRFPNEDDVSVSFETFVLFFLKPLLSHSS